jgi:O-antigen/teichoic acid export membrane protein
MAEPVTSAAPLNALDRGRLVRGMFALLASQLLTVPISMVMTAVLGRHLHPAEFGSLYLAQTAVSLGFMVADWGMTGALGREAAVDRSHIKGLLGTSIVLKTILSFLATAALLILGWLQHYSRVELWGVLILAAAGFVAVIQASGTAVLRGFERTSEVSAIALAGSLFSSALVIGFAVVGFGLRGVFWAFLIGSLLPFAITLLLISRAGIGRPRFEGGLARRLFGTGSAFLFFGLVQALQPYIDNAFLARLVPPEVLGWQAATRRISGLLIFPAASLGFSIYPTLARLHAEAPERESEVVRKALSRVVLAGVPAALGAILFARPAVALVYGGDRYAGAAVNLQTLAPWVFLVYFSILIGSSLMATGKVVAWSFTQAICLVVSVVADAPLIGWFQSRMGNGAMGVSTTSVISELLVVGIGAAMLPRATLRGGVLKSLLQAAIAGAAMVATALLLTRLPVFSLAKPTALLAAVVSLVPYVAMLFLLGALKLTDVRSLRDSLLKRAGRKSS